METCVNYTFDIFCSIPPGSGLVGGGGSTEDVIEQHLSFPCFTVCITGGWGGLFLWPWLPLHDGIAQGTPYTATISDILCAPI
jgi:hypothetical protein